MLICSKNRKRLSSTDPSISRPSYMACFSPEPRLPSQLGFPCPVTYHHLASPSRPSLYNPLHGELPASKFPLRADNGPVLVLPFLPLSVRTAHTTIPPSTTSTSRSTVPLLRSNYVEPHAWQILHIASFNQLPLVYSSPFGNLNKGTSDCNH